MGLLRLIILSLCLLIVGCGTTGMVNFNDGTWAMCKSTDENGKMIANLPFPIGGLPPGAGGTVDGITVICTPIPKAETPAPEPA